MLELDLKSSGKEIRTEMEKQGYIILSLYILFVILGIIIYFSSIEKLVDYGDDYPGQAINLLEGFGLSSPSPAKWHERLPESSVLAYWAENSIPWGTIRNNQPSAFWLPAYVLWLAFWFKLFGYYSPVVNVIQIFLMGTVIFMVYYLGKKLFDNYKVGIISGLLLVVHPYLLRFPHTYPSENLFIPLLIGAVCLWYWCKESPNILKIAIFSAAWALLGLTRMVGIYLAILAVACFYLASPKLWRYFFLTLGIFTLLWGAWMYRNAVVLGHAKLFPTKAGYNLWWANNRVYLDRYLTEQNPQERNFHLYFRSEENKSIFREKFGLNDGQIDDLGRYDYPPELVSGDEVEINRALTRLFWGFFEDHPGTVIQYSWERLLSSFTLNLHFRGHGGVQGAISLYFVLLFSLGLVGFIMVVMDFRKWWFMVILTLVYLLFLACGLWGFRFRVPLDPILGVYAGGVIVFFSRLLKTKLRLVFRPSA